MNFVERHQSIDIAPFEKPAVPAPIICPHFLEFFVFALLLNGESLFGIGGKVQILVFAIGVVIAHVRSLPHSALGQPESLRDVPADSRLHSGSFVKKKGHPKGALSP
jgi:hypothetical protein